jgi:uncharacterized protein YqhQ
LDFKKIFIKDARPTKVGGQAVLEGIMMKGEDRTALAVRLGTGEMYITTDKIKPVNKWRKVPIVRGVLVFVDSLVTGVTTLMKSAELLEEFWVDEEEEAADAASADGEPADAADAKDDKDTVIEESRFTRWLEKHFGENAPMTFALIFSVVLAIVFTVGIFMIMPTWVMGLLGHWIKSGVALNIIEGVFRILLFVLYILAVSRMKDIQTVFQFHGAEHECIHCFESGRELTPDNCQDFETLHPRCGTSFLMFVMVIALLLFSLLGWPNLLIRIVSRVVLVPVIAGLSYELLRWAGSSTSPVVKVLSVPGLLLQKLTTLKPNERQLEVAIAAMKAVLVPADTPVYEGICGLDGQLLPVQHGIPGVPVSLSGREILDMMEEITL